MTTILGINYPSTDSAILIADRQETAINRYTHIPSAKLLTRKLWVSKDGNFCFGNSGGICKDTYDFIQKLVEGGFDIQKILKKGHFPELRKLNHLKMGDRVPNPDTINGLVFATRFDGEPKLYTCFPLGRVEERMWTTAGSGVERVQEYMDAKKVLAEAEDYNGPGREPDTADIIQAGLEAVRRAQSQDIYSHGLDMLVCTPEKIIDHYAELGDDFARKLRKIQKQYRKKKQ